MSPTQSTQTDKAFIKDKQTADMRAISLRTEDTFDVCLAPLKKVKGAVL